MADRKDDATAKPVSHAASLIKTSNDAAVELSENELDGVAGGTYKGDYIEFDKTAIKGG